MKVKINHALSVYLEDKKTPALLGNDLVLLGTTTIESTFRGSRWVSWRFIICVALHFAVFTGEGANFRLRGRAALRRAVKAWEKGMVEVGCLDWKYTLPETNIAPKNDGIQ